VPYKPSREELLAARIPESELEHYADSPFKQKGGCTRCGNTGYKGRIGIFQFLAMSDSIASLAARGASKDEIEQMAMREGMATLWADGIEKVAAGITSFEELARVVS
jgi:type II secretory ATPase GspE/PulE/Tfp pilus assembly ATPase PilB-like protein